MQGIYKIESPSGRFYIGSSVNVRKRINVHKRDLRLRRHINSVLTAAADKYGVENLKFIEFLCVINREDLRSVEQQLIDELKPDYNISKHADCALFDQSVIKKRVAALSKQVMRLSDKKIFASGYEAARFHNCKSPDNLSTAIKTGRKFAGHFWCFVDQPVTETELAQRWLERDKLRKIRACSASTKSLSKPVKRLSDGVIFSSATAASLAMGGYKKMISEAIGKNRMCAGSKWEYV